jgi:hypothetical protein
MKSDDLVFRLRKRAGIRRQISTRKSVQNNEPDRIADLLEEAAATIEGQAIAINYWIDRAGVSYEGCTPDFLGYIKDEATDSK